jgi:hypothetical protein
MRRWAWERSRPAGYVEVRGSDPFGLDADGDGIGCDLD